MSATVAIEIFVFIAKEMKSLYVSAICKIEEAHLGYYIVTPGSIAPPNQPIHTNNLR